MYIKRFENLLYTAGFVYWFLGLEILERFVTVKVFAN